jgi:hypothetical protein
MAYFSDVGILPAAFSGSMRTTNTNRPLRTTLKGLLLVYVTAVVWLSPASGVLLVDSGTPEDPFAGTSVFGFQFLAQAFSLSDPAFISNIEAFISGNPLHPHVIQMQLTSAIGPAVCCTSVSFAMRVLLTKTAKSQFVSKNSDVSPATAGRLQEIDQFLEAALHSKLACVKANG